MGRVAADSIFQASSLAVSIQPHVLLVGFLFVQSVHVPLAVSFVFGDIFWLWQFSVLLT